MKKLYIFAENIEESLRPVAIAVVMYYCAVVEKNLIDMVPEIKLDFLAWSRRSDEIGEVFDCDGLSKDKLFSLIDEIDEKLINDNIVSEIVGYWKGNFAEFTDRTKETDWQEYGCSAPNEEDFTRKINNENVAFILNSIIVNLLD